MTTTPVVTNPLGDPSLEASYLLYIGALEPCPGCGHVDEMDNITGQLLCAACSLDEHDDDQWDGPDDHEEYTT